LLESGVDDRDNIELRKCDRSVVFPEPDSPRNRTAWFSPLDPNLAHARAAISSAAAIALPSFDPSGPRADDVYVLKLTKAWEESFAVGRFRWNRLARCAVRCASDCRYGGRAGRLSSVCCGALLERKVAMIADVLRV